MAQLLDGRQALAFFRDAFDQGAAAGRILVRTQFMRQRMAAPRFREARHQRMRGGRQEHDLDVVPLVAQQRHIVRQAGQRLGAARIDGDGQLRCAFVEQGLHQAGQQGRWQVVDTIVAGIFQHIERDGFTGAGYSGDKDDMHRPIIQ